MAVLVYLPKLKRHLDLAFGVLFPCDFSMNMFLIYLILSQDIKQNKLLRSPLDNWWCQKILRFIFDQPLKQW